MQLDAVDRHELGTDHRRGGDRNVTSALAELTCPV